VTLLLGAVTTSPYSSLLWKALALPWGADLDELIYEAEFIHPSLRQDTDTDHTGAHAVLCAISPAADGRWGSPPARDTLSEWGVLPIRHLRIAHSGVRGVERAAGPGETFGRSRVFRTTVEATIGYPDPVVVERQWRHLCELVSRTTGDPMTHRLDRLGGATAEHHPYLVAPLGEVTLLDFAPSHSSWDEGPSQARDEKDTQAWELSMRNLPTSRMTEGAIHGAVRVASFRPLPKSGHDPVALESGEFILRRRKTYVLSLRSRLPQSTTSHHNDSAMVDVLVPPGLLHTDETSLFVTSGTLGHQIHVRARDQKGRGRVGLRTSTRQGPMTELFFGFRVVGRRPRWQIVVGAVSLLLGLIASALSYMPWAGAVFVSKSRAFPHGIPASSALGTGGVILLAVGGAFLALASRKD
jgi:hypothetical protein